MRHCDDPRLISIPARAGLYPGSESFCFFPESHLTTNIFPVPAQYGFIDESGDAEIVEGTARVAQLTSANQGLPSLLGWDVLKEFEILINQRAGSLTLRRL